jgi:hypothetical protein
MKNAPTVPLTHAQFDADLTALHWDTAHAAVQFGRSETWLRKMRRGEADLNMEWAAWARRHAQSLVDDPPPQVERPERWMGGRRSKADTERALLEAAQAEAKARVEGDKALRKPRKAKAE